MASRLPKLQLPTSEEARTIIKEASAKAADGEMKEATKLLKDGVAAGHFNGALQRQIATHWSAGNYDIIEAPSSSGPVAISPAEVCKATPKATSKETHEEKVTRVMRRNGFSRKQAEEYVDEGGLEMEQMQAEMNHPMDEAFEKMKAQGPPQWFIDMMTNAGQDPSAAESEAAGAAAALPAGLPAVLAPPASSAAAEA